jgi:hypothetical protein
VNLGVVDASEEAMVKGVWPESKYDDQDAWLVWEKGGVGAETKVRWIPPCRKLLEHENDYPKGSSGSRL